jgi:hypothetical protein
VTYAVSIDVHAPAAAHQALHAQLLERTGGQVDGLLAHLARPTADGFQVVKVWDTKASYDHHNDTVIAPLTTETALTPPAGTDTDAPAASRRSRRCQSPRSISAGSPSRAARSHSDHQQADASNPGKGKTPHSCGAQISQTWISSFPASTEPAPVQNGGYLRARSRPAPVTMRDLVSDAA